MLTAYAHTHRKTQQEAAEEEKEYAEFAKDRLAGTKVEQYLVPSRVILYLVEYSFSEYSEKEYAEFAKDQLAGDQF